VEHWTALALSCEFGCAKSIELLLARGADVNILLVSPRIEEPADRDPGNIEHDEVHGNTALTIGCQSAFSTACCEMLLRAGANIANRDGTGNTALWHSYHSASPELMLLLLQAGADPNVLDNFGSTIHQSARNIGLTKKLACLQVLLDFTMPSSPPPPPPHALSPFTTSMRPPLEAFDINQITVYSGISDLDKVIIFSLLDEDVSEERDFYIQRGALTCAQMARRIAGGCGKLLESNVRFIMDHFGITREEAGLALSVYVGRLDFLFKYGGNFPRPGDPVDIAKASKYQWMSGIVTRGPDWPYSDEVDGRGKGPGGPDELVVGYLHFRAESVADHPTRRAVVDFPLVLEHLSCHSQEYADRITLPYRLGFEGKYDLVYAPYRY